VFFQATSATTITSMIVTRTSLSLYSVTLVAMDALDHQITNVRFVPMQPNLAGTMRDVNAQDVRHGPLQNVDH
jgi:hypothetical protein